MLSEVGVKGVRKAQNRTEKLTKTAIYCVEFYQNTETAVTDVKVVLSSTLEVHPPVPLQM